MTYLALNFLFTLLVLDDNSFMIIKISTMNGSRRLISKFARLFFFYYEESVVLRSAKSRLPVFGFCLQFAYCCFKYMFNL